MLRMYFWYSKIRQISSVAVLLIRCCCKLLLPAGHIEWHWKCTSTVGMPGPFILCGEAAWLLLPVQMAFENMFLVGLVSVAVPSA